MTKLAQGLTDLHSKRGAVDLALLASLAQAAGGSADLGARIIDGQHRGGSFRARAHPKASRSAMRSPQAAAGHGRRASSTAAASPSRSRCSTAIKNLVGRAPFKSLVPAHTGASTEPAAIVGVVERAVAEIPRGQRAADEDQRRALDRAPRQLSRRCRPACRATRAASGRSPAPTTADRAIGAVERRQLCDDRVDGVDREMDDKRRAASRRMSQAFRFSGMREARPDDAGEHDALRHFRHGQLAFQAPQRRRRKPARRASACKGCRAVRAGAAARRARCRSKDRRNAAAPRRGPRHGPLRTRRRSRRATAARCRRCARRADNRSAIRAARSSRHRDRPGSARSDRGRAR